MSERPVRAVDDPVELARAARIVRAAMARAAVKRLVESAPPLNAEQAEQLRALLPDPTNQPLDRVALRD